MGMNIILLSGGSGKRLWPLSNEVRSKQFIKIFKTEDGEYESMVQRIYRQIKSVDADAEITIATSKTQVSSIYSQLGDKVALSVEPCRRDTLPAIALATAYLHDIRGIGEEEPVVVCPVDPLVGEEYFVMLKKMLQQVQNNKANLVLMGIEPTYPSEKYGYILPVDKSDISLVSSFKEKPDKEIAAENIKQGALWNGGVFAYRIKYMLDKLQELFGIVHYDDLLANYNKLDRISFDYGVVEQEKSIQVMRFNGQWEDLGTWNTLTEAMSENIVGDVIMDNTCDNVHVINELGLPVLAMGLHDTIISVGPDGILVSDKKQSGYIKKYVDKLDREIMYAEKSWGCYHVLDVGNESMTIKVTIKPGDSMNYHSHKNRDEVWVVVKGSGRTIIDGLEQVINTGDVVTMQAGCRHTVIAETELILIEVQLGKEISVHDKQKFPLEI